MNLNLFHVRSSFGRYCIYVTFPGVMILNRPIERLFLFNSSLIHSGNQTRSSTSKLVFSHYTSRGIRAAPVAMIDCSLTPVTSYEMHITTMSSLNPLDPRKQTHSGCSICPRHASSCAGRSHTQTSKMKSSTCYISSDTLPQKQKAAYAMPIAISCWRGLSVWQLR